MTDDQELIVYYENEKCRAERSLGYIDNSNPYRTYNYKVHDEWCGGCTLKDLKRIVESAEKHGVPLDTPVCIERVHDSYFEKHGWTTTTYDGDPSMLGQEFFQAWAVMYMRNKQAILIHAHY